jgi:hypothetical protein
MDRGPRQAASQPTAGARAGAYIDGAADRTRARYRALVRDGVDSPGSPAVVEQTVEDAQAMGATVVVGLRSNPTEPIDRRAQIVAHGTAIIPTE